jgi:hypothetical protein
VKPELDRGDDAKSSSECAPRDEEPTLGRETEEVMSGAESFARAPSMGAFDRVVERLYRIDVERVYAELEDKLSLGRASEAEPAILVNELDLACSRARDAHLLYVNARVALEGFEIDATILESDMRAQATAVLQAEKSAGQRNKAITDADVESQMGKQFPDQHRATRIGREKAKRAVEHLKAFADLWASRQQALDAMVRTARR